MHANFPFKYPTESMLQRATLIGTGSHISTHFLNLKRSLTDQLSRYFVICSCHTAEMQNVYTSFL